MRAVAALVLVIAVAGCRGAGGDHHAASLPPGSIALPRLPAQGLLDESRKGVTLRDLHGRRLVWLPRFALYPPGAAIDARAARFLSARPPIPLLHGPHGWYRLDVARHALLPVRGGRLPLAGDSAVVLQGARAFAVERRGGVVLRGSEATFRILSSRLVQTETVLLDVVTGRRWNLPRGCLAAGFDRATLLLACGVAHGAEGAAPLRLERLTPGSDARPISQPLAQLVPEAAWVSPDRAWVAMEGFTGCAASYAYVAPSKGGTARLVYGRSATNPFLSNYSTLLGWSADGRVVVDIVPPYCDTPYGPQHPPRGVYLVDPRTLARTFVTRAAVAMWNPAAQHLP